MSRIDDELRAVLRHDADALPPAPDPMPGIERRARSLRRRRVAGAVAGAAAAALVAVGAPAYLHGMGGDDAPASGSVSGTTTTRTATATSAPPTTSSSARPTKRPKPHGLSAGIEGFGHWPSYADFRAEWGAPVLAAWKQAAQIPSVTIGPTDYLWAGEPEPGVFLVALAALRTDHPYGYLTGLYVATGDHRAVYDVHTVQGGATLLSFAEPLKAAGDADPAHRGWAVVLGARSTGLGAVDYRVPGGAWRPARELSGYLAGRAPSPFVLFRRGDVPYHQGPRDEIRVVGADGNLRYAGSIGLNVPI